MKYIDSTKGSGIAFVIFCVLAFLLPPVSPLNNTELILTVSTFFFAIVYGFYITTAFARYNFLQECVSTEDAYWLSFYRSVKILGQKCTDAMRELIDRYYITSYDYVLGMYYKPTAPYLDAVYDELFRHRAASGDNADNVYQPLVGFLATIEEYRNKASVRVSQTMTVGQWLLLMILGGIILLCLFLLKADTFASQVITTLLATMVVLVLLILRDLNNLRLGGELVAVESGQENFEELGRLRYYNQHYLLDGTTVIPPYVKQYRMGTHKPGEPPCITVVKVRD